MTSFPPVHPGAMTHVTPHRGGMVLTLGILGLIVCGICGVIALIMGNRDIKEIDAGRMDPSGRGLTQAGWILGIIGSVLLCIQLAVILLYLVFIVFIIGAAGAAAASGAAGQPAGGTSAPMPAGGR